MTLDETFELHHCIRYVQDVETLLRKLNRHSRGWISKLCKEMHEMWNDPPVRDLANFIELRFEKELGGSQGIKEGSGTAMNS